MVLPPAVIEWAVVLAVSATGAWAVAASIFSARLSFLPLAAASALASPGGSAAKAPTGAASRVAATAAYMILRNLLSPKLEPSVMRTASCHPC